MMLSRVFVSFVSTVLFASLSLASPAPAKISEDIVFDPMITSPKAGDIWFAYSHQTVTWDTSAIPAEEANATGILVLGYEQDDSENLDVDNPLAQDFPLMAGAVNITVPNVVFREDYIVVLFGDSGNASPEFTIIGGW